MEKGTKKLVANNKKVYHEYFLEEIYEAGIALHGTEVKSLRLGSCNLKDSWVSIKDGEAFVMGMHISPYEKCNVFNEDPMRTRKLLLHKKEIMKLFGLCGKEGFTLVPLKMYFSGSKVKVEIGLCRGKKNYDKRDAEAKKQANRDIERELRDRNR